MQVGAQPVVYKRAPHVAWRRLGDETVVMDVRARTVTSLDACGGSVWEELASPRTGPGDSGELAEFLGRLAEIGLVERTEAVAAEPFSPVTAAPRVLWQEPITTFVSACARLPVQGFPCIAEPRTS